MTEREIAVEMEFYSRREGSQGPAFDFIVAGGQNSAIPHAVPGDYQVRPGDLIVLDFGCVVDSYRSDMTRTVALGSASAKQRDVYNIVLTAQQKALDVIRTGINCERIDKIARNVINFTKYKDLFGHGLGHSLGLEIHEPPRFAQGFDEELPENCVISVEPGIYIPGEFGVRIEDIVVATTKGCENLTRSTKELLII
jgi:Xaa-Pro aminopeptidase